MSQIMAAQQGIPLKDRGTKVAIFDVYDDPVAALLKRDPQALTHGECLAHPVALFFFGSVCCLCIHRMHT